MATAKVRELEKLIRKIESAALEAVKQREYAVSSILEDAAQKVAQKIDGHRYGGKRGK